MSTRASLLEGMQTIHTNWLDACRGPESEENSCPEEILIMCVSPIMRVSPILCLQSHAHSTNRVDLGGWLHNDLMAGRNRTRWSAC